MERFSVGLDLTLVWSGKFGRRAAVFGRLPSSLEWALALFRGLSGRSPSTSSVVREAAGLERIID